MLLTLSNDTLLAILGVGQMVRTTVPPSFGTKGLSINLQFPPFQESKLESTCPPPKSHRNFIRFSPGLERLVQPKKFEPSLSLKKKKKKKEKKHDTLFATDVVAPNN